MKAIVFALNIVDLASEAQTNYYIVDSNSSHPVSRDS